jgi:hypothetical protein
MGHDGHDHEHHDEAPRDEGGRRRLRVLSEEQPMSLIEAARHAYGGRARSERGVGAKVRVRPSGGPDYPGVVLFVEGAARDVLLADGTLRRATAVECHALAEGEGSELDAVAEDAARFADLDELQRVSVRAGRGLDYGMIVEKCRYGALVMRDDGSLVGVSFRDINPR